MTIASYQQGSPTNTEVEEPPYEPSQEMSSNPAYSSHFPSDWVLQSDEDAVPSGAPIPTQRPEQAPLPTSSLAPSSLSNAASMSPQYLTYFPASWVLTSSSSSPSPSPSSSSPSPLLPISKLTDPSVISPEMPKPQKGNYSRFSETTLRPYSRTLFPTSRTNSWQRPQMLQSSLVQRSDADWIKAAEKTITAQLSPSLGQGRQPSQRERDLTRQSLQPLLQNAPSCMQLQQDLQPLGLNDASYQDSRAISADIESLEHIEGDEMDERYGDMPHRAPTVSTTYSVRVSTS